MQWTLMPLLESIVDWWIELKHSTQGAFAAKTETDRMSTLQKVHKTAEVVSQIFGESRTQYNLHTSEVEIVLTFHVKNTKKQILTMQDVHFCGEFVHAALGVKLQAKLKGDDTIFRAQTSPSIIRTSQRDAEWRHIRFLCFQSAGMFGVFYGIFWVLNSIMEHGSTCVWMVKTVAFGMRHAIETLTGWDWSPPEEEWEIDDE